jgi:hypothetical protein
MEQGYKGFTIRTQSVRPAGTYARHWFGIYQRERMAFEAEVQVRYQPPDGLDSAERLAALRGRQWVHQRIDRGDYVPGQLYKVRYLPGNDQPEVATDLSD